MGFAGGYSSVDGNFLAVSSVDGFFRWAWTVSQAFSGGLGRHFGFQFVVTTSFRRVGVGFSYQQFPAVCRSGCVSSFVRPFVCVWVIDQVRRLAGSTLLQFVGSGWCFLWSVWYFSLVFVVTVGCFGSVLCGQIGVW